MILTPETPNLPLLPEFRGDDANNLALAVFSVSSLSNPDAPMDPGFGNADRLAELGFTALRYSVTKYYFKFEPLLSAQQIKTKVPEVLEDPGKIEEWLNAYKLKARLPVVQGDPILSNSYEMTRFFFVFVGAVFYNLGTAALDNWIFALLNLGEGAKVEDIEMALDLPPGYGVSPPHSTASHSGSATNVVTLAVVNQVASQKKHKIEYFQDKGGQDHTPMWTVKCLIDGIERGSATSSKIKTAKEEAARRAFITMGWP